MRTTLEFTGVTERILEKAVQLGLARSKTDALRMGVFALNSQYQLVKDIQTEMAGKTTSKNTHANQQGELADRIKKLVGYNQNILAVLAFGSQVEGRAHAFSDVDICLVMPRASEKTRRETLLKISGTLPEKYDVKVFEDLPLMLKGEVIKNNNALFIRNENELHGYLWNEKKIYDDYQHQYKLAHTPLKERLKKWKKRKG